MKRIGLLILMGMVLASVYGFSGCTSCNRDYHQFTAENFGSNWIVVQYRFDGKPMNCWKLRNVALSNESSSDGIYWKDTATGHLVHISGWYNYVQVFGDNFEEAARLIGVDNNKCGNGVYPMTN